MTIITCPHCGADETTSLIDESALIVKCQVCGGEIEKTTDAEKVEAAKPTPKRFNGELMDCCMCGKTQRHVIGMKSEWTLIGEDPFLVYVCPDCLQYSDQAKRGHFATVYAKIMRRYLRLRERRQRGLDN